MIRSIQYPIRNLLGVGGSGRGSSSRESGREATRRRTTGTASTTVSVSNTALLVVVNGGVNRIGNGSVDAESEPSKETVADAVTEESVLHDRVDALNVGLFLQQTVVLVESDLLGVGSIRLQKLDLRDEILVKEGLSDVASIVVSAESLVGLESGVGVGHDVDVGGSAGVVTGEDGLELGNTITVGLLDASEPGVVDVGLVRAITVAACDNTGVNTSGIAVPHLQVQIRNRLASLDINDLVVKDQVNSLLVLDEVLTDVLASDVYLVLVFAYNGPGREYLTVRTLGDIGSQETRVEALEKGSRISLDAVAELSLVVRLVQSLVGISLLQCTLLASLFDLSRSTSNVAGFDTTGLELVGAVSEGSSLGGGEKVTALCGLMGDVVSGMG
jgi:hypothetical protein